MKTILTILLLITPLNANAFAQDSTIISISNGNTWIYDLIYYGSSQEDTSTGVLVKEIIGDTTMAVQISYCDSSISQVITSINIVSIMEQIDTNTFYDTEYWYADSSVVLQNSSWVYAVDFRYVYDNNMLSDTMCFGPFYYDPFAEYYAELGTSDLWGTTVETQTWSVSYIFPGCLCVLGLSSEFTEYFGPVRYYKSSSYPWGSWGHTIAQLRGAIIEGEVYGDTTVVSVTTEKKHPIVEFELFQNYPNPFNPNTTIKYKIPEISLVTIKVYDVLGKEVATLVNVEKPAGEYEVEFTINNLPAGQAGLQLTSGVYFYQYRTGNYVETKKMILLK